MYSRDIRRILGDDITTAFLHGHSFTGNPVGCASALASLDLLESSNCADSISRIADRHSEFALKEGACHG